MRRQRIHQAAHTGASLWCTRPCANSVQVCSTRQASSGAPKPGRSAKPQSERKSRSWSSERRRRAALAHKVPQRSRALAADHEPRSPRIFSSVRHRSFTSRPVVSKGFFPNTVSSASRASPMARGSSDTPADSRALPASPRSSNSSFQRRSGPFSAPARVWAHSSSVPISVSCARSATVALPSPGTTACRAGSSFSSPRILPNSTRSPGTSGR